MRWDSKGRSPEKSSCSFGICPNNLDPPPFSLIWTIWTTFLNANMPKKLGRALPPLNWTKSKRTATFFRRPSPREPSVLIISSHPIFCARFLNHWTIMHAILFLIFSAAQFWTLSDVWRWATENFTTFGNWKRATEIARKFKKMSNGEFYNFGALKKSCGD